MVRSTSLLRAVSKDITFWPTEPCIDIIRNPRTNKVAGGNWHGLHAARTAVLGIHGLLPPTVLTQEEQLYRTMQSSPPAADGS
ncbi:hypothetical protein BV898_06595 [Hypsibius exemplaris]|uniref:Uncharacterized protein n=1 Tax=Hypsibius exemplaris TaxID=2072580 RepID=A0A1W0WVZ7_HYPEX|nr:hypothetical protein BV898_06595 [Hypsibius exemplaris]